MEAGVLLTQASGAGVRGLSLQIIVQGSRRCGRGWVAQASFLRILLGEGKVSGRVISLDAISSS